MTKTETILHKTIVLLFSFAVLLLPNYFLDKVYKSGIYSGSPMEQGVFRYVKPDETFIEISGTLVSYVYTKKSPLESNCVPLKDKSLSGYRCKEDYYTLFKTKTGKYIVLNVLPYEKKCKQEAHVVMAWEECEALEEKAFSSPLMRLIQSAESKDLTLQRLADKYNIRVR